MVNAATPMRQECLACEGDGWLVGSDSDRRVCPCCQGVGSVEPCEHCEGTGYLDALGRPWPCPECEGVGQAGAQEYV